MEKRAPTGQKESGVKNISVLRVSVSCVSHVCRMCVRVLRSCVRSCVKCVKCVKCVRVACALRHGSLRHKKVEDEMETRCDYIRSCVSTRQRTSVVACELLIMHTFHIASGGSPRGTTLGDWYLTAHSKSVGDPSTD